MIVGAHVPHTKPGITYQQHMMTERTKGELLWYISINGFFVLSKLSQIYKYNFTDVFYLAAENVILSYAWKTYFA